MAKTKGAISRRTIALQARANRAVTVAQMLPAEAMLYKMRYWLNRFASEQAKGEAAILSVMETALDKAEEAAKNAAPYYHSRLAAITHSIVPYDLSKLTDEQLAQLETLTRAAAITDADRAGEGETRH